MDKWLDRALVLTFVLVFLFSLTTMGVVGWTWFSW